MTFRHEFDAVFSNAALHWIHEPVRVIQSVWNALRPGGRFVAEFGGKGNIRKMQAAFDAGAGGDAARPSQARSIPGITRASANTRRLLEKNGFEVRFMTLFDRPTALADGEAGMRNWIAMFGSDYLAKVDAEKREAFLSKGRGLAPARNCSRTGNGGRITGDCVLLRSK